MNDMIKGASKMLVSLYSTIYFNENYYQRIFCHQEKQRERENFTTETLLAY